MRAILIDWLIEVHMKFKLVPGTLYLTVNLVDRYLEKRKVTRQNLQSVGVTCLLIASKYEEIYPPGLCDIVYICDNAYTRDEVSLVLGTFCDDPQHVDTTLTNLVLSCYLSIQILEMEEEILKTLKYKITVSYCTFFPRSLLESWSCR